MDIGELKDALGAILDVVRSPKGVLAALAGNSIAWRVVPDVFPPRVATVLADVAESTAGPTATTLVGFVAGRLAFVAFGIEWLMLLYALHLFLPRLSRVIGFEELLRQRGLRLLVAGYTLSISIAMGYSFSPLTEVEFAADGEFPIEASFAETWVIFMLLVGIIPFSVYLWRYHDLSTPERRLRIIRRFTTVKGASDSEFGFRREDWIGWVADVALFLAMGTQIWAISITSALGIVILNSLFPLPEVLVLCAVAAGAIDRRVERDLSVAQVQSFNLESNLLGSVAYALGSIKGMMMVILLFANLLFASFLALISMALVVLFTYEVGGTAVLYGHWTVNHPLLVWLATGFLLVSLISGFYSLWFWLRLLRRLPFFLEWWHELWRGEPPSSWNEPASSMVTRPPDHLLIPVVSLAVLGGFSKFGGDSVSDPTLSVLLFALAWPLLVILFVAAVRHTRHRHPQPARTDGRVWGIAIAAQTTMLMELNWISNQTVLDPTTGFSVLILELVLLYLMDFNGFASEYRGHTESIVNGGGIVTIGVIFGLGAFNIAPGVGVVFGGVLVVLGFLYYVGHEKVRGESD